jgi:catechol 2,3-dioxygenase-like lactoylglutathione lyase family enzyme
MFQRCLPLSAIAVASLLAQTRPPIVGVAHVALKTNDLAAARQFYSHDLGFAEMSLGIFKVNDHQQIELYAGLKEDAEDRLINVAFETTNAIQLAGYLKSRGVGVPDYTLALDRDGNLPLEVNDPEGRTVRFIQYKSHPATRAPGHGISTRIIHAGFIVQDRAAEDRFYKDILGFTEMWHGGKTDTDISWVDMRVPDGDDWLEYMLNVHNPTPKTRGVMNHLALGVPNMEAAYKNLTDRGVNLTEKPKIGRDGKWQLNLYDPNLTRVELMEPKPVETPCCSPMRTR